MGAALGTSTADQQNAREEMERVRAIQMSQLSGVFLRELESFFLKLDDTGGVAFLGAGAGLTGGEPGTIKLAL